MRAITKKNIVLFIVGIFLVLGIWKLFSTFLLSYIFNPYINILGIWAFKTAQIFGLEVSLADNTLHFSSFTFTLSKALLTKTWIFFIMGVIWITPVKLKTKYWNTLFLIVLHILTSFIALVLLIFVLGKGAGENDAALVTKTFVTTFFKIFLLVWIYKYRKLIIDRISKFGFEEQFIYHLGKNILILLFITIFINNLFIALFEFEWLTAILFTSSQKILALFGYDAIVNGPYLEGINGNIRMDKYCMGIWLMFYFSAFIILTGVKIKTRIFYIFIGIVFINIINIVRFVLLFIHLQKNGNYLLAVDYHDLFNYAVYIFILIAWIIWIEKFSDIWTYFKLKKNGEE